MTPVLIAKIVVPENRYRREFDEKRLDELKSSIKRNGLWHPIVVERKGEDAWVLRAGERRLRVLTTLEAEGHTLAHGSATLDRGYVPTVEFTSLSELQRLEIEVEENVIRVDFTWQERVRALAALHALRLKQDPTHSVAATATEVLGKPALGSQRTVVSDALIIAKHLANPEVAKAKDTKEALKVIRKGAEALHQAKLAQVFDLSKTEHKILKGEASELLKEIADETFDVIVTDPPYGVGADNFGSQSSTGHDYEDSKKNFEEILSWLPDELFRVAKKEAHLYLFCDQRWFIRVETLLCLAGWSVFPTALIWYKGNGMLPLPEHGPRRTYESIIYAYKGEKKTLAVRNDCITKIPGIKSLRVAAQKPVALYRDLLSRSAAPGDHVLDCFGGSGPILVASNIMRLTATYMERDEEPFNIALSRANTREIDDGAEEDDGISIDFGAEA